jgi:hypothetical protein
MKDKILLEIKEALKNPTKGQNSMGCSENYYNPHYSVGGCFTEEELNKMPLSTLEKLLKLAKFLSERFY